MSQITYIRQVLVILTSVSRAVRRCYFTPVLIFSIHMYIRVRMLTAITVSLTERHEHLNGHSREPQIVTLATCGAICIQSGCIITATLISFIPTLAQLSRTAGSLLTKLYKTFYFRKTYNTLILYLIQLSAFDKADEFHIIYSKMSERIMLRSRAVVSIFVFPSCRKQPLNGKLVLSLWSYFNLFQF